MAGSFPVGSATAGQATQRIHDEHAALRRQLEELAAIRDLGELLPALERLQRALTAHFANEEGDGGLHAVVGDAAPHLLAGVQGVFDEHRTMMTQLEGLVAETRAYLETPARVADGVRDLVHRLHEHEAKESELLSESVNTDLGES